MPKLGTFLILQSSDLFNNQIEKLVD